MIKNRGRGLILFGGLESQTKDSLKTHILVNFLNSALGNEGQIVNSSQAYAHAFGSYSQIQQLVSDLNLGRVKRLIIHGVNPLYSYPRSEELLSAIKKGGACGLYGGSNR